MRGVFADGPLGRGKLGVHERLEDLAAARGGNRQRVGRQEGEPLRLASREAATFASPGRSPGFGAALESLAPTRRHFAWNAIVDPAPLGLAIFIVFATQGCALGYRRSALRACKRQCTLTWNPRSHFSSDLDLGGSVFLITALVACPALALVSFFAFS